MLSIDTLQKARRVLGSVRGLRFSRAPLLDVSDRIGLLTVTVGLRDVGVFGVGETRDEESFDTLRNVLENQGLHCLVSRTIRRSSTNDRLRASIGDLCQAFERVDAVLYEKDREHLLWVFGQADKKEEIERVVEGQVDAGSLLGYPPCCVGEHRDVSIRADCAFAFAIVKAVGADHAAIEKALLEDLKVRVPEEEHASDKRNVSETQERFPFVFHIACSACLSSHESPTAERHREHEAATIQVDRGLHRLFGEMSRLEIRIHRLMDEGQSKGEGAGQFDKSEEDLMRKLFYDRDRLYNRILNG